MIVFLYVLMSLLTIKVLVWGALLFCSAFWCIRQDKAYKRTVNLPQRVKTADASCRAGTYKSFRKLLLQFFEGVTRYTMLKTGKVPSFILRNFLYRHVFRMKIHRKTTIYGGCEFRDPYKIHIGISVIGPSNIIDGRMGVKIGDQVCTGTGVKIWTLQHDPQDAHFATNGGTVEIEDRAWVASFSTILPNKKIGTGAVISCGAIITKDCEPYTIYAGVPGVKKGCRNEQLCYHLEGEHWWFL